MRKYKIEIPYLIEQYNAFMKGVIIWINIIVYKWINIDT